MDKTTDGADRVLVLDMTVRRLRSLERVQQTIQQHIPPGYLVASLEVKAFLEKRERGRL